jgi:hypothetical protein
MKNAFIVWNDVFTGAELDAFEEYGDRMLHQKAQLALAGDVRDEIRITRVAWLEHNRDTAALYERLIQVTRKLNEDIYRFEVTGLETIQYSVYHGVERR